MERTKISILKNFKVGKKISKLKAHRARAAALEWSPWAWSENARGAPPAAAPAAGAAQRRPPTSARVLVLGGTGRVGGSTATALSKLRPDHSVLVGDRNRKGTDLVFHAAGPFQREEKCAVLEAAISTKHHIDVCNDTVYLSRAKSLHERAKATALPAITTAGIYPGVSNDDGC
ncbi:hypothetical protein ACP4OV_003657 [Aristida adscensionis]